MRRVIDIAILHIKLIMGQRSVLFFSFLMPIIFTALMGQANFGVGTSSGQKVNVVNEDQGEQGQKLIAQLQSQNLWKVVVTDRSRALPEVKRDKALAALIIPANFSESINQKTAPVLDFHTGPGAGPRALVAEQSVRAAVDSLNSPQQALKISTEQAALATAALNRTPSGAEQSSPGMLVMFAMLFMVAGTNVVIYERQLGTLRRLMIMPMSKNSFLLGKLLGIFVLGIFQMTVLILAGVVLFGVSWGQSPSALILMVISFALVNTSLGILLATLVRTAQQANALASMAVMAFSALGGAWWPLDIVPRWMNILGHILPSAWAMDGFHAIIIRGQSAGAVVTEMAVLLAMGIVFLLLSFWNFSYD